MLQVRAKHVLAVLIALAILWFLPEFTRLVGR